MCKNPLVWLLLLVLASCTGNDLLPETGSGNAGAFTHSEVGNPYQRSEDEAKKEATSFLSEVLGVETRSGVRFSETQYVLNNMARVRGSVAEQVADTLLYVLRLQGGGSMVVSGDQRVPAVLVYVEEDATVPSKLTEEELNEIGEFALDCLVHHVSSWGDSLYYDPNLYQVTKYKWINARKQTIEPMISAIWDQGYPWNARTPILKDRNALAGCGAIAVGMLTTRYRYPKSVAGYNLKWDLIDTIKPDAHYTPCLVREIGNYLGNEWGLDATGAKVENISPALRKLGYSCSDISPYQESRIFSNIKSGFPVIVTGYNARRKFLFINLGYKRGHAWVIDGAIQIERKRYVSINGEDYQYKNMDSQLYVHCKWGQYKGTGDGYYFSRLFDWNNEISYNEGLRVVYDIKPNKE